MDTVTALEWGRILLGEQPVTYIYEIFARILIVYVLALLILRMGGKRARKQMTPLELLLVVALGSAVGDVLFYPTVAILYTVIILLTVLLLQWATSRLKRKSALVEDFINSKPKLLIKEGKMLAKSFELENLTTDEVFSALREQGVRQLGQVEYAFLELTGNISVFKYSTENVKDGQDILPLPQTDEFLRS